MIFEQIRTGGDRNFGYLFADPVSKQAAVVDPSGRPDRFLKRLREQALELTWVLITHDHYDHIGGTNDLLAETEAKLATHPETSLPGARHLADGEELKVGALKVRAIHTPGHTDDGICFLVNGHLMTGDTLFIGKVGGTGGKESARKQYDSLHTKLMTLPDETKVYPGHDVGVKPESTIGDEKRTNPFILQPDFEQFLYLKLNWAEYKRKHRIA